MRRLDRAAARVRPGERTDHSLGTPAPGERLYGWLLLLYPRDFRDHAARDLREFYRDVWRDEVRGAGSALLLWAGLVRDVVLSAPAEHLTSRARRLTRARSAPPPRRETDRMRSVLQDVRLAVRSLARRPGFTVTVLLTLALGIGANAAIFSVVHGILLKPLPFRDPSRLVSIGLASPHTNISEGELFDLRRDLKSVATIASFTESSANVVGDGTEPERVGAARVSDGFFTTLGVAPARGRAFTPDEERPGGTPAIIISDGLWRRLGADPSLVGRQLRVGATARTVVGVMPPHFDFPSAETAIWTPLRLNPDSLWGRNNHYMQAVGRLRDGATAEGALTEIRTIVRRWPAQFPDIYPADQPLVGVARPITDAIVGDARPYLMALAGAVVFVLLIACANVANLLLARGESRRRELAVRAALGASRARLVRQTLTEGALLGAAGGLLALLVAYPAVRGLVALAPDALPRVGEVRLDPVVLAFTAVVSIATGLLASLVPALRSPGRAAGDPLREGGKGALTSGGSQRVRGAIVVAEVALAVVTLGGAGLMMRSLWNLRAHDLGMSTAGVLTMYVTPTASEYDDARAAVLWRELVARVAAVPGVRTAAATGTLPISNEDDSRWSILLDGRVTENVSEAPSAKPVHVTPQLFAALGIPILRGRGILDEDREGAPPVGVVNETMARTLWPGQDPVGHTFRMMGGDTATWTRVVGVVRDVRSGGFLSEVPPTFYVPHAQGKVSAYYTPRAMVLVVRTDGDPAALATAVRHAVRAVVPTAPVTRIRTMEETVAGSIGSRRFATTLLLAFAALALLLAGVGIYGVIAYSVTQRVFEIGVRMALGAQRRNVMALVLGQGMRLASIGLVVGVASALASTRLLRSMLVDVSAVDAPTLLATAAGLLGVALVASAVPARRAMSVSPTEALKGE